MIARAITRLRRDPGLALLVLALVVAAALYAATLGRGLVDLDDTWLVRDNWLVRDPSWSSLRTIFFDLDLTHRFALTPEYLPVRDLSVMADYAIWGTWFGGFHLTNVVLYLASIALWFRVLEGFGIERTVAGLAVLLWALHPSHAESVAWLSERKGVLGMMFAGACGLAYVRVRSGRGARWLALAVGCAVCAVWSKALAAFAIATLGGLELVMPASRVSWRRSLVGLGTIGVVAGLAFVPVLSLAASSSVIGTAMRAPAGRVEMAVGTYGFYLRSGVFAVRNAVSYSISTYGPSAVDLVVGAIALVASGFVLVLASRRPAMRAGAAIWLVGWFPISHLVLPLQMVFVADRYVLLPTLGLALVVAAYASSVAQDLAPADRSWCSVPCWSVAALLLALDAQTSWRDSRTLWERAIESEGWRRVEHVRRGVARRRSAGARGGDRRARPRAHARAAARAARGVARAAR